MPKSMFYDPVVQNAVNEVATRHVAAEQIEAAIRRDEKKIAAIASSRAHEAVLGIASYPEYSGQNYVLLKFRVPDMYKQALKAQNERILKDLRESHSVEEYEKKMRGYTGEKERERAAMDLIRPTEGVRAL
ncbi:MAG TPA: hypothetical protein VL944_02030 [Candidatus Acidoferrum sp.]|nr:hypothetical protein [Candidatus Acidoferrum sp.]